MKRQEIKMDRVAIEADLQQFLLPEIQKKCPHIPIEKNLSAADFKENYVKKNRPVILRGLLDKQQALKKWDFDFFAEQHGHLEIEANLYDPQNTKKTDLKSLIQEIKTMNSSKFPVYLQEWWFQTVCPELPSDVVIPEHFADDFNHRLMGFHNFTLWIGSKGSSTPLHQDLPFVNIWTSQIRGKKEWVIFDKNAKLFANENGQADYAEFLENSNNGVMHCLLEQGDVLYVPFKWWHRVRTIEDAISLNTFYVTEEILQRYVSNILAIPIAVALNKDLLLEHDLRRYNICMTRINMMSDLLGFDKSDVLRVKG